MPPEDGVGGHDGRKLAEESVADGVALRCEAAPFVVGEPERLLPELLAENVVLLVQVLEDVLLLAVQPAGEGRNEEEMGSGRPYHGRAMVSQVLMLR